MLVNTIPYFNIIELNSNSSILSFFSDLSLIWYIVGITFIIIYIIELFRYKQIVKIAKVIPKLSSVSIGGEIGDKFNPRHADELLYSHISQINELYKRALQDNKIFYGEISEIISVFSLPKSWKKPPDTNVEQKNPIKIGPIEFYYKDVLNILFWVFHILNPYYLNYIKLKFYIKLTSIENEIQVTVTKPTLSEKKKRRRRKDIDEGAALTELMQINNDKKLSCISRMLWDSSFMIFQLHFGNNIPGHNWKGMKHFTEGLAALELFSRTENNMELNTAINKFEIATLSEYDNYDIMYLQASLLLYNRTEDSINNAFILLKRALKTNDEWLKVLINVAIANCYAQHVHRFDAYTFLSYAEKHLNYAKKILSDVINEHSKDLEENLTEKTILWNDNNMDKNVRYAKVKIKATKALMSLLESSKKGEDKRKFYVKVVKQYWDAQKLSDNTTDYSNAIGYIYLKIAELPKEITSLKDEELVDQDIKTRNLVEVAEIFFQRALDYDPSNKLTYANLCLLYRTHSCLKQKKDRQFNYLDLCRFYGYKVIQLWPDYINGYFDFIESLLFHKKNEEAIKIYKMMIQLHADKEDKSEIRIGKERINKMNIDKVTKKALGIK